MNQDGHQDGTEGKFFSAKDQQSLDQIFLDGQPVIYIMSETMCIHFCIGWVSWVSFGFFSAYWDLGLILLWSHCFRLGRSGFIFVKSTKEIQLILIYFRVA